MTQQFRILGLIIAVFATSLRADSFLVRDGQPNAEIIIAHQPQRSTRLAAAELRTYVEKISGARLPIATEPSEDVPVQIYVGESTHAEKLGIAAEGLEYGAYRIVSGENWLALIGDDTDFVPKEPWARNNGDRVSGKLQREWEAVSGLPFGVPNGGMYKNRARLPGNIGKPDGAVTEKGETLEIWGFDERGSFNAVCGFLRNLGVRWYVPGELGEIVPQTDSIPLPRRSFNGKREASVLSTDGCAVASGLPSNKILYDETVEPDFEVRQFCVRFGTADDEVMRWAMRLGIRQVYGLMIAHGMHTMTRPDILKTRHPDWFALYGGRRDTQTGKRLNHLCYSNEELFDATVRWARAQYDVYDYEAVSIMPPDAYGSICQCELCERKQLDEMGSRGKLSNHVWDFANRVAREVGKTHPDKLIACCAYGANTDPPTNLDKLEPNVQVVIVGGRRPRNSLPEQREAIRQLRTGWLQKTDRPILIFENYPFTGRGFYLPAFVARTIGDSINATKGVSRGEDIWLSLPRYHDDRNIGFDHFQVYFTARMWWGGKDADVVAMLEEYCDFFYGPAGSKMKAFFDHCEDNWQAMEMDKEKVDTALAIFAAAKSEVSRLTASGHRLKVGRRLRSPDSKNTVASGLPLNDAETYAARLQLIDRFLNALRSKAKQLAQGRGPVAKMRTVWEPEEPIVIDGKLDDQYWVKHRQWSVGRLRELQTGGQPIFGTTIMAGWDRHGQNLYFAIRCEETVGWDSVPTRPSADTRSGQSPNRPHLNITATKHDDEAIWYGDVVEIELDTDSHSYYQIAVNPAGALVDLDRGADKSARFRWESQAEVATHVAADHWTVEIRIPVTQDENDPLNHVIGRKPSVSLPWHFNICRQRIRDNGSEHSAFSPTGTKSFHVPMKFAYFYDGRSHTFDVDEAVTDFLIEASAAGKLMNSRKYDEALAAFVALSNREKSTDFQKSHALAQAAACARLAKNFERADELAGQIPIESVLKTVQMHNLAARREWTEIVAQFGEEDLNQWPFWQIGEGAFARGRGFYFTKKGDMAEADLQLALEYEPETRIQVSIRAMMAHNREANLGDDAGALKLYRLNYEGRQRIGGADEFRSVDRAAAILTKQGKHEEALAAFQVVDFENQTGFWLHEMLISRGNALAAAGRNDEAAESFRRVTEDESALEAHRKRAAEALAANSRQQ